MRTNYLRAIAVALCLCLLLPALVSCHGSRGRASFEVPSQFDTEKQYEISFWAKNENNPTQQSIYKKAAL